MLAEAGGCSGHPGPDQGRHAAMPPEQQQEQQKQAPIRDGTTSAIAAATAAPLHAMEASSHSRSSSQHDSSSDPYYQPASQLELYPGCCMSLQALADTTDMVLEQGGLWARGGGHGA